MQALTHWLAGDGKPPIGIFLRAIDLVIEEGNKCRFATPAGDANHLPVQSRQAPDQKRSAASGIPRLRREDGEMKGLDYYLGKPVDTKVLLALIEKAETK